MNQTYQLINKQIIYNLHNHKPHTGEYFEIIHFKNQYFLYYNDQNKINVVISNSLDFNNYTLKKTVIHQAPGGCFCIIKTTEITTEIINQNQNILYMLCGCHKSNKESNEINIPDLVWPKEKRTILKYDIKRVDRKNGMYLLQSQDGIQWKEVTNKPVLHSYIQSNTCKLGEVCFDTHPQLIQFNNTYYFYGRLNSSLDERRIYVRESKDLKNWSLPIKINIKNENNNILKKNYYNFAVFQKDNILYACTPYFEACGTEKRQCKNGQTLLLQSENGVDWSIVRGFLPHQGKYKDRVNGVLVENNLIKIFLRENCTKINQKCISYDLII